MTALADYFHRSAIALSQVVLGYDEVALAERLNDVSVEVCFDDAETDEATALLDLLIRLLARLYPSISFVGPEARRKSASDLAKSINPKIHIGTGTRDNSFSLAIGLNVAPTSERTLFVGSDQWDATVSTTDPQACGSRMGNPFGAGAAACLAAASLFRQVFGLEEEESATVTFSALDLALGKTVHNVVADESLDIGTVVLVGLGAIGNATAWALGRSPFIGQIHLVDHEEIELGNLQRYVLARRSDESRTKVDLAKSFLSAQYAVHTHVEPWRQFVAENGYQWDQILVALDSAQARRDVQASLPKWIANAWTQPEDLGISVHPWTEDGACLACLYLPVGPAPSEDRVIGSALGLDSDTDLLRIRRILHANDPLPADLYDRVSSHLGISAEEVSAFSSRSLRELYVEGLCGGLLLPLSRLGRPNQDVHVPVVHQSALAGVLLASRLVACAMGVLPEATATTRIDLRNPLAPYLTQNARKDPRGICICQDPVYRATFTRKYGDS